MNQVFDVVIVGAGPAGLFAAMEIVNKSKKTVLLIEQVKRLHDTRNVANGWMGGSARSDVSLFFDPGFGGEINNKRTLNSFVNRLENYGGFSVKTAQPKITKKLIKKANKLGIEIDEPSNMLLSSEKLIKLEERIQNVLKEKITIKSNRRVEHISKERGIFKLLTSNETFFGKKVMLGLGRGGARWLLKNNSHLHLPYQKDRFDLGIRLEFPAIIMSEFTNKSSMFRLRFGDYRTTAPSVKGQVDMEDLDGVKTANGRSVYSKKTHYTSIALLKTFYDPDPLEKVYNLTQIVNVLADGQLLKEPLSRLLNGTSILSPLPEFAGLSEGVEVLLSLFPQIRTRSVFYAPESRLNAVRFKLSPFMEAEVEGLYLIGDMSGMTKSFVQAACTGLLAAQHAVS